ncbi:MAG: DUF4388 domain-containing protein [Deltaproteobacteria bacterium]|nr:DUF4388 domain-containing protein [Deltaproteobacteria bacterium]
MALFGTFDTMPLTDVIQWILQSLASGRLVVTLDMEETTLIFKDGDLVSITGESLRFDLGHYLLRQKKITEDDLQTLMQPRSELGSMKARMVSHGILEYSSLVAYERSYAMELLLDLVFATDGSFHFTPGENEKLLDEEVEGHTMRLEKPISTKNALLDVMRRMDEWNHIREVFPSNLTVVSAVGESDNFFHKALTDIGIPIAIGDLCMRLELGRFVVYEHLYALNRKGLLTIDRISEGHDNHEALGPIRQLIENAEVLLSENQFEEARELLSTILGLEPENSEARKLARKLREEHLKYLYQQIPPHLTPVLTIPRVEFNLMPLSQKELFLGSRLNGKWDVGMLVVSTSLGELDTLRVLRKLIHAGIARLQ